MAHSCELEFLHQLKGRLVITSRTPGIHLSQNHRNQLKPLQHDYNMITAFKTNIADGPLCDFTTLFFMRPKLHGGQKLKWTCGRICMSCRMDERGYWGRRGSYGFGRMAVMQWCGKIRSPMRHTVNDCMGKINAAASAWSMRLAALAMFIQGTLATDVDFGKMVIN